MIPPTRQPKPYRRPNGLPFARGDDWRPLRLVLDDDSLPEADLAVLLSLADEAEIDLTRTRPGRLPWLEPQQPADDHVPIHQHAPAGGTSMFWVWNAASLAERARRIVGHAEIDEHAARRALIFAEASEELENDGFVTAREFLLQQNSPGGPAIYNANEALALIGLTLRLRRNMTLGKDLFGLQLNGTMFYFVLAHDLLHAGWRWFSGCVAYSRAVNDDTLLNLGQAALERFVRVLQIRDRIHAQAKIPQRRDTGDELVFQFETLLLFLSASLDAAARVAHLVYLHGTYEEAGWRRPTWHQRLTTTAPKLAALVADATPGAGVLKLISRLRNTIHGQALRPIEVRRGSAPPRSLVELSPTETAKLEAEIALLGETPQQWGLTHEHARTYLAVDRYTEALLPHAVMTLNDLMAATAIERLAGVDAAQLLAPPADLPSPNPIDDVFSHEIRQRVRLLAGL